MKQANVATMSDTVIDRPLEERMLKSVRTHYQSDHQEEFLRLKAQIESLFAELQTLSDQENTNVLVAQR